MPLLSSTRTRRGWVWRSLLCIAALIFAATGMQPAESLFAADLGHAARKPNIVLIITDDK